MKSQYIIKNNLRTIKNNLRTIPFDSIIYFASLFRFVWVRDFHDIFYELWIMQSTLTLVPESSRFPGNFKDIKVLMIISKLLLSTFIDSEQVRIICVLVPSLDACYLHGKVMICRPIEPSETKTNFNDPALWWFALGWLNFPSCHLARHIKGLLLLYRRLGQAINRTRFVRLRSQLDSQPEFTKSTGAKRKLMSTTNNCSCMARICKGKTSESF